jgi:hypothetical protein
MIVGTLHKTLTGNTYIDIIHGNGITGYEDPVTGYGQSWFNIQMFTATNTTPSYTPEGIDMVYPYRYKCCIVTDIKPNPNNTGSTNPNWRVRSTYSY